MSQSVPPPPPPTYGPPPNYGPPAGYSQQPPTPPKKKHRGLKALIGLVVLIVLIVIITQATGGSSGKSGSASGTVHVVYELTSDASTVSATYATLTNGNIGQQQDNSVAPPWTKEMDVKDTWIKSFVLAGQMNPAALSGGHDGTTITCKITVDGKVLATQTSTGQYAAVTCASS